jgi:hypothetical protein
VKRFMDGGFVEGQKETVIDKLHEKPYTLKGSDFVIEILDVTSMEEFSALRNGWYASCDGKKKKKQRNKERRKKEEREDAKYA